MFEGLRSLFHRSNIAPVIDADTRPVALDLRPGSETLVVALAGYGGDVGIPRFEFRGALASLDCSTAFVRQVTPAWYHGPIEEIGNGLDDLAEWVGRLQDEAGASRLVLLGSSMGAYAAIYVGWKTGADHVVAFAPQTFLGPIRRARHLDIRWMRGIRTTWRMAWPNSWRYLDLLRAAPEQSDVLVDVYVPSHHRLDRLHALRLVGVPGVTVHLRPSIQHMVVKEMRDSGQLERILRYVVENDDTRSPGNR